MKPIIQTKNLEVTYNKGKSNEFKALKGETVDIYPQEYIILFGPSGCGKSTLLYCILGALPSTDGEILVKGENIYNYDSDQMVRYQQSTIGIVYQSFNLIPSLNVLDNVSLPQIFAGVDTLEREARARVLLKRFDIEHIAHKLPMNLSGGQMQRVAVARSLINDPEILLADEPVGNLDSISAEQVMNTFEEINQKDKKTIILVTHDAKYLPYAHRVYYVRDGKLEREVINPEKEQIKKTEAGATIVTEVEKLARIYPYSSPDELRVKSIINYLTQDLNFEQLSRLEGAVKMILEGKVSIEAFLQSMILPLAKGGVGLTRSAGGVMTTRIEKMLNESRDVMRLRKIKEKHAPVSWQKGLVRRLRSYVLEECPKQAEPLQIKRLEQAITERVWGITKKEEFQAQLVLPIAKDGAGFGPKSAHDMTLYLEKLLAQGVPAAHQSEKTTP